LTLPSFLPPPHYTKHPADTLNANPFAIHPTCRTCITYLMIPHYFSEITLIKTARTMRRYLQAAVLALYLHRAQDWLSYSYLILLKDWKNPGDWLPAKNGVEVMDSYSGRSMPVLTFSTKDALRKLLRFMSLS
jgi:hypothetical protein